MKLIVISFLVMAAAEYDIDTYIHNGKPAQVGEIPYQVSLMINIDFYQKNCAGSLISPTFILTVAHCINKAPAENVTAFLGSIYRYEGTPRVARRKIVHTGWSGCSSHGNDIGLLQIDFVNYTSYIKNVALPAISSSYPDYEGDVATVSGWGFCNNTHIPRSLQYAELSVISNAECAHAHGGIFFPSTIICAANPNGAVHCAGDSGGPLVHGNSKTLIGIVSFIPRGVGCAPHLGNGYTRVTSFRQWIKDNSGI